MLRHEFDLLGSGPTDLGPRIDWHRDFKTGYKWPTGIYHARIDRRLNSPDSDIKVPWELSRCQFLPTLGRAYWHTGDERFPAEFTRIVDRLAVSNPPETGVNWSCAMDVAIRAVNWLWAYHLVADSAAVTPEFERRFWAGLFEHGRYLYRNLEGAPGEVNSNHYLSDLAGLMFLGLLVPEYREAGRWRALAERGLVQEMDMQVLDDGVDWELSTSYQRLAAEIFLSCAVLCRRNGRELPVSFHGSFGTDARLCLPLHTTGWDRAHHRGRGQRSLQRLTTWERPQQEFIDHRHLLAAGALLFDREDWAAAADGCWEEALWLFGADAEQRSGVAVVPRQARARGVEGLRPCGRLRHALRELLLDRERGRGLRERGPEATCTTTS